MPPTPTRPHITFGGHRYYLSNDGYYKRAPNRSVTIEHWLLHRAVWAAHHGPIPARHYIRLIDGDRSNYSIDNLMLVPYGANRRWVEFAGKRFYRGADGYYQSSRPVDGERLLHRVVWTAHHGPIADGIHIHHEDWNPANNDLSNLRAMPADEHLRMHKARPMGASAEDFDTRSRRRREEWQRKQPREVECAECGKSFESTGVRAKFCEPKCRKRYRYRHFGEGKRKP